MSVLQQEGAAWAAGLPGPAFAMHYSQKAGKDLTAAVYSVGGTLDRDNMMFIRVGSSSFYHLTLPHGLLPSGFYTRHRIVMAKPWAGGVLVGLAGSLTVLVLHAAAVAGLCDWCMVVSTRDNGLCAMQCWEGPDYPGCSSCSSLIRAQHPPRCVLSLCSFFAEEMAQEAALLWVWNAAQKALSRITLMLEAAEIWPRAGTGRSSKTEV